MSQNLILEVQKQEVQKHSSNSDLLSITLNISEIFVIINIK